MVCSAPLFFVPSPLCLTCSWTNKSFLPISSISSALDALNCARSPFCRREEAGKVIVPDKWKEGASNILEGGGRKINGNKLLQEEQKISSPDIKTNLAVINGRSDR